MTRYLDLEDVTFTTLLTDRSKAYSVLGLFCARVKIVLWKGPRSLLTEAEGRAEKFLGKLFSESPFRMVFFWELGRNVTFGNLPWEFLTIVVQNGALGVVSMTNNVLDMILGLLFEI